MKKRIWLISILLACLAFVLCACGSNVTATLRKTSAELKVGETVKLVADVSDPEAEISWSVSDDAILEIVATTSSTATVKALSAGTATVYVKYGEKILAECKITVPEEILAGKLSVLLPTGKLILRSSNRTATVRAIADESLTGEVTWTVSDETVISLEYQGLIARIKSLKRGRATVTVSCDGEVAEFEVIGELTS